MHDDRLKGLIPEIMEAISAYFTPMLNIMYSVQSDLYQHLYASVYEYATSQGLTNTDNLVEECNASYDPIRQRVESEIKSLREGKIARIPVGEFTGKQGMFARKSSGSLPPSRPTKSTPLRLLQHTHLKDRKSINLFRNLPLHQPVHLPFSPQTQTIVRIPMGEVVLHHLRQSIVMQRKRRNHLHHHLQNRVYLQNQNLSLRSMILQAKVRVI